MKPRVSVAICIFLSLVVVASGLQSERPGQSVFDPIHQEMLLRLVPDAVGAASGDPALAPMLCWAEDTDPRLIEAFKSAFAGPGTISLAPTDPPSDLPKFEFPDNNRWSATATDGAGLLQGDPTNVTWSIVPDGTSIPGFAGEPTSNSNLIAFLDGIYGSAAGPLENRPWFPVVEAIYIRWSELTGINYIYEPNDDGAAYSSQSTTAPGILGVRGDARVGGHFIDGNSGILAYNFFPDTGEMVIDTGDNFYQNTINNSLRLRNVMAHEVGHGIGVRHVCPTDQTKLMEPFISVAYDGPQFDDILAGNRGYGDPNEFPVENDGVADATDLGAIGFGGSARQSGVSIDDVSDTDWYAFTAPGGAAVTIDMTPVGFTYLSGPQLQSCTAGVPFDALRQSNLGIELIGMDGTTVLATANANGLGEAEVIADEPLAGGAGTYHVRVFGDANQVQMYDLDVTIPVQQLPDLACTVPPQWDGAIVASSVPNTSVTDPNLTAGEVTYVDWAIINDSAVDIGEPACTIDFDVTCPNAGPECGATFSGGLGCVIAGLPFCYDTGSKAYQVDAANPLTITLDASTSEITVFFAHDGATTTGTMRFYDAMVGGNEVGTPMTSNGDCNVAMPPRQTRKFVTPIRRIEVTVEGPGSGWVDTMTLRRSAFSVGVRIDGVLAKSWILPGLTAGERYTVIDEPFVFPPGDHTIGLWIDIGNTIPESDENNNECDRMFNWQAVCSGPRVIATDVEGWNGQQVSAYVALQESPVDVDAFTLDMLYDTNVLSYRFCEAVDLTQNWLITGCSENTPGEIRIQGINPLPAPPIPAGTTGNLIKLYFDVIGCSADGQASVLTPTNLQDDFAGMDVCRGTFTCRECQSDGDVTNDGNLTAGDALCCFNIALLESVPPDCDVPNWDCELIACDVNCDNNLTAGDALEIFNHSLSGGGPSPCFGQFVGQAASTGVEVNAFDVPLKEVVSEGTTLRVPVLMEAARGQAAFGFEILFDSEKVKFDGMTIREAAAHWKGLGAKELEPGRVRVMGFDTEGLKGRHVAQGGTVEIAALRFEKLSDDAQLGSVRWIEQRLDRERPEATPERVTKLDLSRPYPNPFRDAVSANVLVPSDQVSTVRVTVYDVKGRVVRVLLNESIRGGTRQVTWDRRTSTGQQVSSGIYFLQMEVKESGFAQTRKLVVLK